MKTQGLSLLAVAQDALRQLAPNTGSYLNEVCCDVTGEEDADGEGQSVRAEFSTSVLGIQLRETVEHQTESGSPKCILVSWVCGQRIHARGRYSAV